MADFQVTFVQAARDLKATNVAAGDPTPVTYMEIGEGTTAPALADTAVETPFASPIRFADPEGSAIGDAFTFLLNDSETRAYTLYEVCWFSGGSAAAGGGTLLHRVVIATGLDKPLNAQLHYPLVGRILGEDLDTLSFTNTITIPSTPGWSDSVAGTVERASPTEAVVTSNHSNAKGLSVLRGWQQIVAWWGWVSALGANLKASQAQAQAGTNDTKAMTPLRTKEAIEALFPGADVQTFNASGTWTQPAGAKWVHIAIWGASNDASSGNPGAASIIGLPASVVSASEAVTIGAVGNPAGHTFFGSVFASGGRTGSHRASSVFDQFEAGNTLEFSAFASGDDDTPFIGDGAFGPGANAAGRAIITTFF